MMKDSPASLMDGWHTAFVPMRLHLQPTGLTVVCNRPRLVLGRHSSSDIRLPLPDVSRQHCRLQFSPGVGWTIHDMNSTNGIYLNGERIRSAELRPGDRLRIGGFEFEVELPDYFADEDVLEMDIPEDNEQQILRSIAESLAED